MSDISSEAPSFITRFRESDLWYNFKRSPGAMIAAFLTFVIVFGAIFANFVAPHNPFDLSTVDLFDGLLPPAWAEDGKATYLLGTDDQGRDVFSTILYGSRISLIVGFASVGLAAVLGITVGLIAGYSGGMVDSFLMRVADVQLSFPAILIALLIDGVARGIMPRDVHDELAVYVLVVAIGLSFWVQYARTVRSSVMVERNKEYVQAGQVIGLPDWIILIRHILPNVMGPVLVIATIQLALAIITEATLSFLGVGVPPTSPSLGTLIRIGNDYLFSGEWWITIFPGVALVVLVLSVNILGDWLRDALNPKLR
ncbi:ABC transporter permease [Kiloniella litopenaei]|uniref:ABC transporter permease n=1 Tax=Kiloniella litopenaei TaxID=1549748 RepID=A0A0M2R9A1_9PROT|nr:ABC transporter permease [Kiloniella litopenaei]KKJ76560.1 ABC transporter permease [Kiloniella litopenaei]